MIPTSFPYRYGHAFWAYVAGRWGDEAVGDMLRATGPQGDIKAAMETVLGVDEETFTTEWHDATRRTYAPFFETTRKPDAFGRALITSQGTGGDLNLSPALSPDGKRLVFLSERSLFSIDMYLADAATGRIIRKIVETAGDPHFDSLQFLSSAGDWAPDNRRFVFAAPVEGAAGPLDRRRRQRQPRSASTSSRTSTRSSTRRGRPTGGRSPSPRCTAACSTSTSSTSTTGRSGS